MMTHLTKRVVVLCYSGCGEWPPLEISACPVRQERFDDVRVEAVGHAQSEAHERSWYNLLRRWLECLVRCKPTTPIEIALYD